MRDFEFEIIGKVDADFQNSLFLPLELFNREHVGESGYQPLGINVRLVNSTTSAGLWGHTANNWLVVELLYVPEVYRHQGVGTRLVKLAEDEAIARGCYGSWLDTFEYQAREFYEKIGYRVFGQLENYPNGTARYFMSKSLSI